MHIAHVTHDEHAAHTHHGFAHPHKNVAMFGLEPDMIIADFGAGSGAYTLAMAEVLAGTGHVYAIDVQRDLLTRIRNDATRHRHTNVRIIWGDLERPGGSKLADRSVDLVLISNMLFQADDKPAVIAEAARVLKPKGRMILIDWTGSHGGMGPRPEDVVAKDHALALLKAVHFESVSEFAAGAHHWGVIAARQ